MKLFLLTTNKCNMTCEYCYYNCKYLNKINESHPSIDDLVYRIEYAKGIGVTDISLSGGEPFTRPNDMYKLINLSSSLGIESVVVTNGMYFLRDDISVDFESLNKLKVLAISLHIDRFTNVEEYLTTMRKIVERKLNKFTKRIRFNYTLTKHNSMYLKTCLDFADSIGIHMNIQPVVMGKEHHLFNEYSLSKLEKEKRNELKQLVLSWGKTTDNFDYSKKLSYYIEHDSINNSECFAGKSSLVIKEDGSVSPCFYREDINFGIANKNKIKEQKNKLNGFFEQDKNCGSEQCIVRTESESKNRRSND